MQAKHNPWAILTVILLCAIGIGFIYLLSSVLLPFLIAAFLAYLCNPLVIKGERMGLSRLASASLVFSMLVVLVLIFFIILIPLMQKQVINFMDQLPHMIAWLKDKLGPWFNYLEIPSSMNAETAKNFLSEYLLSSDSSSNWIFATVLSSGKAIFEVIIYLVLIPVVTFYLLRDWKQILNNCYELIPVKMRANVVRFAKECDKILSGFFRGQLLVMLCLGIFYSVALALIGLKTSVIIGIIIGLISIVPYLGAIIGIFLASLAALVQFGSFTSVLWVWAAFAVGHSFENFYLTPKLIGDRIGLHPVVVIFSIMAGGTLFGIVGVILALPVTAIALVLLRHTHNHYKTA